MMRNIRMKWVILGAVFQLTIASMAQGQTPLGSAFTYQGRLHLSGSPVNDTADFDFTLWSAELGGDPIGSTVAVDDVDVVDGVFTVELDFGVIAFNGDARWLEIAVRSPHDPGDTQPFTTLAPRQPLTAAPYAIQTRGLFVDDAGDVGIGTTAPESVLHVAQGDLTISHDASAPALVLKDDADGDTYALRHQRSNNQLQFVHNNSILGLLRTDGSLEMARIISPRVDLQSSDTAALNFNTTQNGFLNSSIALFSTGPGAGYLGVSDEQHSYVLNLRSGQVGIGTTTPTSTLDVAGTVNATAFTGDGSGLTNIPSLWTENGAHVFRTSGRVGIGTSTPTTKLDVVGTVTATAFAGDGSGLTNVPSVWTANGSDIGYTPGNVGIGTNFPQSALDVHGSLSVQPDANVDQSQTGVSMGDVFGTVWQSFTAGTDGFLTQIDVRVNVATTEGNGTIRIYAGEGTGGALLTSQSYSVPTGVTQFAPIAISPLVEVQSGNQYTFEIIPAGNTLSLARAVDTYPGGTMSIANSDLTFRTYAGPGGIVTTGIVRTGELEVQGDVRFGADNAFHAVADTDPTVMIRGQIQAGGATVNGRSSSGVTSGKLGTGHYLVGFPAGTFTGAPIVTVTPLAAGDNRFAVLQAVNSTTFEVQTRNLNGNNADSAFDFIAIGQR